jgi:tRNA(Glu) U13 pseudouridine synthase TruD
LLATRLMPLLTPTLPLVCNLPGIGGGIKATPAHFCVTELSEEQPPFESGKHAFVTLMREGQTTREVQEKLARLLSVRADDVGIAGLKDRHARVVQEFSLPRDNLPRELRAESSLPELASRITAAADENGWTLCGQPSWKRSKARAPPRPSNRLTRLALV